MERILIYLDDQCTGMMACPQCGAHRVVNVSQQCPQVLTLIGEKKATITCRCGAVFTASFDMRRHPRKVVQLQGELAAPQACAKLSDMAISSLSVHGLGFVLTHPLALQRGEIYTTSFRLDDAEQSRIRTSIIIRRLHGHTVGAEFYPYEQYNYALDFYVYGCDLMPPPRPVPGRVRRLAGATARPLVARHSSQSVQMAV